MSTNGSAAAAKPIDIAVRLPHERLTSLDKSMPPASPTLPSPTIRRNKSDGKLIAQDVKEARVKVIYTGGTIGMVRNDRNVLAPIPNALVPSIRSYPNIHDEAYALRRFGASASMAPLVLPFVQGLDRRILYQITEYTQQYDNE